MDERELEEELENLKKDKVVSEKTAQIYLREINKKVESQSPKNDENVIEGE